MKKVFNEKIEYLDLYFFDGDLNSIINNLNIFNKKYIEPGLYESLQIETENSPDDGIVYILYGNRLETDKEYNERIKLQKEASKQKKANKQKLVEYEKKLYEQLKKKYGN